MSLAIYEAEDRVAVITMNRPESRNAMSPELSAALGEAFDQFDADDERCGWPSWPATAGCSAPVPT